MTPTTLLLPTYANMLQTLATLLEKAAQQMPDRVEALLSARLAPDMYPLSSQIRFAAYQAQEASFRLRGEAVPEWLDAVAAEGRNGGETPGSLAEARTRIDEALSFVRAVPEHALDARSTLPLAIELPGGLTFDISGEQYVRDWALPQFYFHVVTAYAILRDQGVTIGKGDYVPHMFAYLRPQAA
ncbi:DUF1993 domain-containing protein [Aureimonas pseudogalii]|uniref:DUF1993 domain-containing protein n=1 Tax=Aureimonas pseudogalii TaxID=1744844 RepID=A0A7W6EA69_9HYPH|nr:DUF1993 domain-containing protein [Aureimonas pseudogalii]MBB3997551.1 hypothetical protein [Aureimonas pseudogalii]